MAGPEADGMRDEAQDGMQGDAQDEWIESVGIDIGTSTTKMILSRLRVARVSGAFALPSFAIAERVLTYAGRIRSTPLLGEDELDFERVTELLAEEYARAGVAPERIRTGAVIITGETANKTNAERVLHSLAERAGDFVVATAGADLEGLLAGKGSGAEARSLETGETVVNVDIGGGTANAAFFRAGACIRTATLRIGGRLVRVDAEGNVLDVARSFAPWLAANGFDLRPGTRVGWDRIRALTERMAETLLSFLAGRERDDGAELLRVGGSPGTPGPLPQAGELLFSGGVAELMRGEAPATLAQAAAHGDIGPALAHAVLRAAARYPFRLAPARETVRATVIGAGMQAAEISGATIYVSPGALPVRNVPVVRLDLDDGLLGDAELLRRAAAEAIERGGALHAAGASPPFALSLTGAAARSYAALQRLADALCGSFSVRYPPGDVLAVICRDDMAKALGHALAIRLGASYGILCIDQVAVEHGDYIDIGEPVAGSAVPVVVKTLAFSAPREARTESPKGEGHAWS